MGKPSREARKAVRQAKFEHVRKEFKNESNPGDPEGKLSTGVSTSPTKKREKPKKPKHLGRKIAAAKASGDIALAAQLEETKERMVNESKDKSDAHLKLIVQKEVRRARIEWDEDLFEKMKGEGKGKGAMLKGFKVPIQDKKKNKKKNEKKDGHEGRKRERNGSEGGEKEASRGSGDGGNVEKASEEKKHAGEKKARVDAHV